MNPEKLKKLQSQVRIGGKGTPRRKKKVVHQTPGTDDKKLQSVLKKIGVNPIPGIEEVNMIKSDGSVIHFNNPKTQASLGANTFAITAHGDHKQISDMIGNYGDMLKYNLFADVTARSLATAVLNAVDDEVPTLVEDFEDTANKDIDENTKSNVIDEIAFAV